MSDSNIKLMARVQALELVLKNALALQFVSSAKTEADLPKVHEHIKEFCSRLLEQVESYKGTAHAAGIDDEVVDLVASEMATTVRQCFDYPAEALRQIADVALQIAETPSSERH